MKTSTFFDKCGELLLGVAILALAGVYLAAAVQIQTRSTIRVNAKFIPELLGTLALVLGFLQTVAGIRRLVSARRKAAEGGACSVLVSGEEIRGAVPVALTFVLIIGYACVLEFLGFVVASVAYMVLQMLLLAPREKRRPLLFAAVAAALSVVAYLAFREGLDLTLPQGILGNSLESAWGFVTDAVGGLAFGGS